MSALAHSIKYKMCGFLKTWFAKPVENQLEPPAPQCEVPSVSSNAAPVPKTPANPVHSGSSLSVLELPLSSILSLIPSELHSRLRVDASQVSLQVPVETVLPQLARGTVKITFGELRQAAPGAFFSGTDRDHLLVQLPLGEVLARMNPALLTRRPTQKRLEVPKEITGPFADQGQGLAFSVGRAEPEAAPLQPAMRATRPAPVSAIGATREVIQTVPRVPDPGNPPAHRFASQPVAIHPVPPTLPDAPRSVDRSAPVPAPVSFQPAAPPTVVPSAASGVASNGATLMVPLADLTEAWPDALRQEMSRCNLCNSIVALPWEFVEAGLKAGHISCTWKELSAWIKPAPAEPPISAHDAAVLSLPLRMIAPIFLAKQRAIKAQPKAAIDQSIPNLFFGAPQPDMPVVATPPTAPLVIAPSPQHPKPADTNFYVWKDDVDSPVESEPVFKRGTSSPGTEFLKRYATPNEIISRAAALEGVAGALISLPDGLLVASRIPPELNADTLAAFLPLIFGRVSQCTKELRMGELNNLNFTVGNVAWKIFKVGAIFFAAFGRMGEPLPTAQLVGLAAELDRRPR
jgi:predicted regulator of Ras-like GTPase activity (Roadblock/LC7/MglB family)